MKFYLGTHHGHWLRRDDIAVPLFVSHRTLAPRKVLPRAVTSWALDSGGFSELSLHGRWVTEVDAYIDAVRRYRDTIGNLDWAAPMDWMCEPFMLAKTGLTVACHQAKTVDNFMALRDEAPDLPFIPVLQGWAIDDYLACIDRYSEAGVDLAAEALVGVGSVCRRQSTGTIAAIFRQLDGAGLSCHGFGVKHKGLARYAHLLASADSMAWSYDARMSPAMPGCVRHKSCQNCPRWALRWRQRLLRQLEVEQGQLW